MDAEMFHYRKLKSLEIDMEKSLQIKPDMSFQEEEDKRKELSEIFSDEFFPVEKFSIEKPPPFEEVTPPEPLGLPPRPPKIKKYK